MDMSVSYLYKEPKTNVFTNGLVPIGNVPELHHFLSLFSVKDKVN